MFWETAVLLGRLEILDQRVHVATEDHLGFLDRADSQVVPARAETRDSPASREQGVILEKQVMQDQREDKETLVVSVRLEKRAIQASLVQLVRMDTQVHLDLKELREFRVTVVK